MKYQIFTYSVIGITVLISFYAFQHEIFIEKTLFSTKGIVRRHEYHRLISSIFIHANIGHLFFNMFSFYSFSTIVENSYGLKISAFIYLYSALGGSLLSLIINKKDENYRALGASGAVCGTIFASIFLLPGGSVYIFPLPVALPAWAFAVLFVFISIYGIGRQAGNIGHDAHLGGALTGVILAGIIRPQALIENSILLAAVVIPTVFFLIFRKRIIKAG